LIPIKVKKQPIIQIKHLKAKSSKLSKQQQALLGTHVLDVPISRLGLSRLHQLSTRRQTNVRGDNGCLVRSPTAQCLQAKGNTDIRPSAGVYASLPGLTVGCGCDLSRVFGCSGGHHTRPGCHHAQRLQQRVAGTSFQFTLNAMLSETSNVNLIELVPTLQMPCFFFLGTP
jgi:hypothetical protein